jgi:TnpA family transposase
MPRRDILTARQKSNLFDLPTDQASLLHHYTLGDDDLEHIKQRRRPENRLGFTLQLCALRYPGRMLAPGELIPNEALEFIGAQIGLSGETLATYAARQQTRHQHMDALRKIYGYRSFSGEIAEKIKRWLGDQAEYATSNDNLARTLMEECNRISVILPAITTIERLCADALVAAEQRIESRISQKLHTDTCVKLDALLTDKINDKLTRFVWLRQFDAGKNSADVSRLLDRLDYLKAFAIPVSILDGIPPHRVTRLKRQGERYFAQGLRDLSDDRRFAILAVCVIEWQAILSDAIVETHDRIVGKTWRDAQKLCSARIDDAKIAAAETLKSFANLGAALLEAHNDDMPLENVIDEKVGWDNFRELVGTAAQLTDTMSADPLAHVIHGYNRFRRYAPRMIKALNINGAPVSVPLLEAAEVVSAGSFDKSRHLFLKRTSKWLRFIKDKELDGHKLAEVAVWFHLRDAFRSGDIWLAHSKRYADLKQVLVPITSIKTNTSLKVPFTPGSWIENRKIQLDISLKRLSQAAKAGRVPGGSIENGVLHIERLSASKSIGSEETSLDLYKRLPEVRITDILMEVDAATGFTEAFTHLRTGVACKDKIGLLNILLAEGINLGLSKMAEATNTHDYWQLMRLSRWHVESEGINAALAIVIQAQAKLPMAQYWGMGTTASSDGQFFASSRQGEAMNLINAKYGRQPGLKAYTHVTDQYGPFATQTIPATVNEAPYILDGLLMNETGKRIKEQYADTGGFTDHVFGITSILGYKFIPRIRDLPSKKLYLFPSQYVPKNLTGLIGGRLKENMMTSNWPDILRVAATMTAGTVPPSQILRKLASYPRQNDLASALREIGRVERTLFMLDWVLDVDMQRRAQVGLNKGESHHALKNALRIGRQGEIRDRTTEGQHFRMAGLNLLAAIVIYWNTARLGEAVTARETEGLPVSKEHLAHISPLGWAHILLTGEYRWNIKEA